MNKKQKCDPFDAIRVPNEIKFYWEFIQKNRYVLISGRAGTGKSFLLKRIKAWLQRSCLRVRCVAPTAVAAVNIGGQTFHSWLGMGLAKGSAEYLVHMNRKRIYTMPICNTDVLIIDEISMVSPSFFTKVFEIAKILFKDDSRPFGPMRIVMFGDFLQMPPVNEKYLFSTPVWSTLQVKRLILTKNYRQNSDRKFMKILNEVRTGHLSKSSKIILNQRKVLTVPDDMPRLCAMKRQVKYINERNLLKFKNLKTFDGYFVNCYNPVKFLNSFPVEFRLKLAVGVRVMYRVNSGNLLYNGSLGFVSNLDPLLVQFDGVDTPRLIRDHRFQLTTKDDQKIEFHQIPLSLAWAFTIHKSQGLTLERAMISNRSFECGQLYTALSRVKSLDGLYISKRMDLEREIKASSEAVKFETNFYMMILLQGCLYDENSNIFDVFNKSRIGDVHVLRLIKDFI